MAKSRSSFLILKILKGFVIFSFWAEHPFFQIRRQKYKLFMKQTPKTENRRMYFLKNLFLKIKYYICIRK